MTVECRYATLKQCGAQHDNSVWEEHSSAELSYEQFSGMLHDANLVGALLPLSKLILVFMHSNTVPFHSLKQTLVIRSAYLTSVCRSF